jgi:hypothetical protein
MGAFKVFCRIQPFSTVDTERSRVLVLGTKREWLSFPSSGMTILSPPVKEGLHILELDGNKIMIGE